MDRISITSFGLVCALTACGSSSTPTPPAGSAGSTPVGPTAGAGGAGTGTAGTAGGGVTAGSGNPGGGAASVAGSGSGVAGSGSGVAGGGSGVAGSGAGGAGAGTAGAGGGATGPATALVTSAANAYWKTADIMTVTTGTADVTVDDSTVAQNWDGFGAAFNEMGWSYLNTPALQSQALQLLFGTEGTHFAWGRIPMGGSDYALKRYTLDDTGTDVVPDSTESNRPPKDTSLAMFSITHDNDNLLPFIKAAQGVNPALRFWSSPWTPPVWMKTGHDTHNGGDSSKAPTAPSYFDGGTMSSDAAILTAYAQYFVKFVAAYKAQNINIEYVAPANEPNFEQNYPSCLWKSANFATFIGTYLAPALQTAGAGTKIMLGTLSNSSTSSNGDTVEGDQSVMNAVLNNATAKAAVTVAGAQWGMLDASILGPIKTAGLPIWATEHKCGNYPWNPSGYPAYNTAQAPNDLAYAVESWGYLSNAINTIGVTSYNAWNMVLDKLGKGNDLSRDWKQDALLVVDGGAITQTPAYYVFRHLSQYVQVGAKVIKAPNANTVAFKNPDGTVVAVIYNSGAAKANYIASVHGKLVQFAMPAAGWATIKM